jgi:lipoyl(octanoyl) transferase
MSRIHISHIPGLTQYDDALALQLQALEDVAKGGQEQAIFLEHPPVFTTGTSASPSELLQPGDIPVIPTGRGGKTTYHGPGQRVVYLILDLNRRDRDLRAYIASLQSWLIAALADLGVPAHSTDDVGVWVGGQGGKAPLDGAAVIPAEAGIAYLPSTEAKIAAIGVRVRKWVAFHGIALNVNPDLAAYSRIVPCGLAKPVTSLHALGVKATMEQVDAALTANLASLNR